MELILHDKKKIDISDWLNFLISQRHEHLIVAIGYFSTIIALLVLALNINIDSFISFCFVVLIFVAIFVFLFLAYIALSTIMRTRKLIEQILKEKLTAKKIKNRWFK